MQNKKSVGDNKPIIVTENGIGGNKISLQSTLNISNNCMSANDNEKRVIEGGEVDMVWIDEGFDELDWIETLRYRLITRRGLGDGRGKLLMTFTPITGFSPVCREYLAGFETIRSEKSELLPGQNVKGVALGEMPYIARSGRKNSAVMWFHTKMNPYQDWDSMVNQLTGRPKQEIKIRAYGFADDATTTQFPQFKSHNIIPHDRIPTENVTRYFACDPGGQKNWFMLWGAVDEHGRKYIYREWPNDAEWAVPGPGDGKKGLVRSDIQIACMSNQYESLGFDKKECCMSICGKKLDFHP